MERLALCARWPAKSVSYTHLDVYKRQLYIVIDDPEILQMRVAIAKRAVKRNQAEELLRVLVDMGGVRELGEPLHHRGLVAAAIFFVGPSGIECAEILESPVRPVHAQIEAVDDQRLSLIHI